MTTPSVPIGRWLLLAVPKMTVIRVFVAGMLVAAIREAGLVNIPPTAQQGAN